jgi:hypothetical protein
LFVSPIMPEFLGLREISADHQQLLLPAALTYALLAVGVLLLAYRASRATRTNASLLYLVTLVYPFVYALSALTYHVEEPRYVMALAPLLVLLGAQLLRKWRWAALALLAATFVSVGYLHRLEGVLSAARGGTPRDFGPLIRSLDRLRLDRVYAEYYVAYRLDFETRERIIAVENRFERVSFPRGRPVLPDDPVVHWEPYEAAVADAARVGFVFFRSTAAARPLGLQLVRHGYRRYPIGPLVVYAPPATAAQGR